MPRPPNPEVRNRLLAAGLDLVHTRGFTASGVKDITDAAGVPKGSFYAYFASKEAFAAAILEHYWPISRHGCYRSSTRTDWRRSESRVSSMR